MGIRILLPFALLALVKSHDVIVGLNTGGRKIFDEKNEASPALWRQSQNVTVNATEGEVISRVVITDLRPDKDGDAKIVEGGEGQDNVTIELKSPTVLRGYDFRIEVFAIGENTSKSVDEKAQDSTKPSFSENQPDIKQTTNVPVPEFSTNKNLPPISLSTDIKVDENDRKTRGADDEKVNDDVTLKGISTTKVPKTNSNTEVATDYTTPKAFGIANDDKEAESSTESKSKLSSEIPSIDKNNKDATHVPGIIDKEHVHSKDALLRHARDIWNRTSSDDFGNPTSIKIPGFAPTPSNPRTTFENSHDKNPLNPKFNLQHLERNSRLNTAVPINDETNEQNNSRQDGSFVPLNVGNTRPNTNSSVKSERSAKNEENNMQFPLFTAPAATVTTTKASRRRRDVTENNKNKSKDFTPSTHSSTILTTTKIADTSKEVKTTDIQFGETTTSSNICETSKQDESSTLEAAINNQTPFPKEVKPTSDGPKLGHATPRIVRDINKQEEATNSQGVPAAGDTTEAISNDNTKIVYRSRHVQKINSPSSFEVSTMPDEVKTGTFDGLLNNQNGKDSSIPASLFVNENDKTIGGTQNGNGTYETTDKERKLEESQDKHSVTSFQ